MGKISEGIRIKDMWYKIDLIIIRNVNTLNNFLNQTFFLV